MMFVEAFIEMKRRFEKKNAKKIEKRRLSRARGGHDQFGRRSGELCFKMHISGDKSHLKSAFQEHFQHILQYLNRSGCFLYGLKKTATPWSKCYSNDSFIQQGGFDNLYLYQLNRRLQLECMERKTHFMSNISVEVSIYLCATKIEFS